MADIYVLVVIYNAECADSVTCGCLKSTAGVHVMLLDNSTLPNNNEAYTRALGWRYIRMEGNKGLARAYNKGIEQITDNCALVCLFDDDTQIGEDYFIKLREAAEKDVEARVFLPLVYDEVGLLSPSVADGLAVRRVDSISEIPPDRINGINSGMAIRAGIFSNFRYDEKYFLDCIDHVFLRYIRECGYKIALFDAVLKQSFFENSGADMDAVVKRFKIFKKDFKRYCGKTGRRYYCREIIERKKALYLKYKSIRILFI
jgi:GT2 family glycosyltransferase